MILLFFPILFIAIIIAFIIYALKSDSSISSKKTGPFYYDYMDHEPDYDSDYSDGDYDEPLSNDYLDYEVQSAKGTRDYFTDDPSYNYNSYYSQICDDAMMRDEMEMEEYEGEFGDNLW